VTALSLYNDLRRPFAALFIVLCALTTACSDNNNNNDNGPSTLGVPGAEGNNTVTVPGAMISDPIEGAPTLVSTFFDLGRLGYTETEYFVSGTANDYVNVNELKSNGKWLVQTGEQADYNTRIVVIRPMEPEDFNGTVMVEWLNVSAGFDSGPDWGMTHTELIREGYAWVGVSAQQVGVDALVDGSATDILPGAVDDGRYDSLFHPGDNFSYDIYSQVAQAIRSPDDVAPLGNLVAEHLIAAGESQSAYTLMTYINALAPIHALFDGYFVHSRVGGSAPLKGTIFDTEPELPTPPIVRVRDDLGALVMMLQTETDLFILGSYPDNQKDSTTFRLWEVAGTAHADLYTFLDNRFDIGTNPAVAAVVEELSPVPGFIECQIAVNAGPQHFVANAAVDALNTWIVDGIAPPKAERLQVSGNPAAFELDELGNVKGGIRTPYVDVPIALLSGEGQPQPEFDPDNRDFCFLSGVTRLFDANTLHSLYADNAAYIEAVNASADEAVAQGFLLQTDAELIKTYAATSDIFAP
jgi:hypothetical protein